MTIKRGNNANRLLRDPKIYNKAVMMSANLFMVPTEAVRRYITKKTNRRYAVLDNAGRFRGFAAVKTFPNYLQLELIAANTRKNKRPPAGQPGWGTRLMNAIKNNAKKLGLKRVVIHDPVQNAKEFYKKRKFCNMSNTTGGCERMKLNLSPNVTSKRKLSPINESPRPRKVVPGRARRHVPSPSRSLSPTAKLRREFARQRSASASRG